MFSSDQGGQCATAAREAPRALKPVPVKICRLG